MSLYQAVLKPFLFTLDAEQAHYVAAQGLQFLASFPAGTTILKGLYTNTLEGNLSHNLAGISLPNPVGLAAGFDKNGVWLDALALLGFGFIEVGTVTPKPQIGNPRPRLFRLPADEAILNRMGFNNDGVEKVARRLAGRKKTNLVVGGNIGKNKWTPNEEAHRDYVLCFNALYDYVDYFTINLSSPNTPGLRQLMEREFLQTVLEPVQNENNRRAKPKPVFLKIAPDMEQTQLADLVETCATMQIAGIVATNTTASRLHLSSQMASAQLGAGGVSGRPLRLAAEQMLAQVVELAAGRLAIISSGGIMEAQDASRRLALGAQAVQLYSGLIYHGPGLVHESLRAISQMHRADR